MFTMMTVVSILFSPVIAFVLFILGAGAVVSLIVGLFQ